MQKTTTRLAAQPFQEHLRGLNLSILVIYLYMCIYYPNAPFLTYNGQEHIIPAAVGGMLTLPEGYVSDQFNNTLSKIEQDLFREGLPGFARVMDGPGKRGSQALRKQKKGKISLISGGKEGRNHALGYIKMKKPYEIPQVILHTDTRRIAFSYSSDETDRTSQEIVSAFREDCLESAKMRCRIITDEKLEKDEVLFGIARKVEENWDCFLAKHPESTFEYSEKNMCQIADLLLVKLNPVTDSYIPTVHSQVKFYQDHLRVFGKIAFNVLTHITSKEFVLSPEFDAIRQWITKGGDFQASWHPNINNYFHTVGIKIPEKAHIVMINSDRNLLYASVILYGSIAVSLLITDQLRERIEVDGFVCDWKNKKEYRFIELIADSVAATD